MFTSICPTKALIDSFLVRPQVLQSPNLCNSSVIVFVQWLTDSDKGKILNWEKRFEIILGIAEGLVYLHEKTETRIVHRDIKASNILLDSKLRTKIADFGLARSFQEDKSHISTAIAGTL